MTWGYKPEELWAYLRGSPGTFALTVGEASLGAMEHLSSHWSTPLTSVGHLLTIEHEDGWKTPEQVLQNRSLLVGVEVMFWPEVAVDPLRLLRSLASRHPVVAAWPGKLTNGRAIFSEPGRPDYYDNPAPRGTVVLHARAATFPDELPYTVERI